MGNFEYVLVIKAAKQTSTCIFSLGLEEFRRKISEFRLAVARDAASDIYSSTRFAFFAFAITSRLSHTWPAETSRAKTVCLGSSAE
jgi:hypothetical protein